MREVAGKVAFVTGGASGIGLGIARTLARASVKVAIADVRPEALRAAAASLAKEGLSAVTVELDVSNRGAWSAAADRVERESGTVQILCSNAGVNFVGATQEATYEDWDFALQVNVGGAISAVKTFVPRMIAEGLEGHVVITSSVSGLFTGPGAGVYVTTKFALVGLPQALAATGSVPIVAPGVAREHTPIFTTAPTGEEIGQHVLSGIRRDELYILTHPEIRPVLEARAQALLAALPDEPVDPKRIEASQPLLDPSLYR